MAKFEQSDMAAEVAEATGRDRPWLVLVAMGVTGGLILLDETIVGVALPSIRSDLDTGVVASHWIINAYMLTFAGFAAAAGRLGDVIGLRRIFFIALAVFGLASLAAGFATTGPALIAARAAQGLGAAGIFPVTISAATQFFPERRGMAMGVVAAIGTTFLAAGPLVGGVFTDLVSWRWVFWVNLPIVALAGGLVLIAWRGHAAKRSASTFDGFGLVTLLVGIGLAVFATMEVGEIGWSSPLIWGGYLVAAIALLAFTRVELGTKDPLLQVRLFGQPAFAACSFMLFVSQFIKVSIVIYSALYLQERLGMSPLDAGTALMVAVIATPFAAHYAGKAADRYGTRTPALLGFGLAFIAITWTVVASGFDNFWLVAPGLLVFGGTVPFFFVASQREISNAVPPSMQGQAGGVIVTARLLGGTVGIAVCSTVLTTTGSFSAVYLTSAVLMAVVLPVVWFAVRPPEQAS